MLETGSRVLVADAQDEWIPGRVEGLEANNKYRIKTDNDKTLILSDKECVQISDKSLQSVDDMCSLDELHQGVILHNLRQRYFEDIIYTYIGPMIVSVNPYRRIEAYGEHMIPEYRTKEREQLLPHPYALAQKAYKSMVDFSESQSVIISGESGAGKTEATKIVLKFLTVASGSKAKDVDLAAMILATNPILEAFGNAKTTRNNNSSRFGKFIRINFEGASIVGAQIDNYLLEKTRLVSQAPTERNYHIFYQFVTGTSEEQKQKYKIKNNHGDYHYLTNGNVEAEGISDVAWFKNTTDSFKVLGFTDEEVDQIFFVLSGILTLGNIKFQGEDEVVISNEDVLNDFCDIMGVIPSITKQSLVSRQFAAAGRGTAYKVPLTFDQAIENRDALAKMLYYKLFDWLVQKLNVLLKGTGTESSTFIGVLDIYGFEIFETNSLEQFCINYANEKLHQQFNQHMFKAEQEEYTKDGVPWQEIKFKDNQGCIDLIEKQPRGIIGLLAEEGRLARGTDETFLQKVTATHGKNLFLEFHQKDNDRFSIKHFAGMVMYKTKTFIEKNKDTLNNDGIKAMKSSTLSLLRDLFKDDAIEEEKKEGEDEGKDSTLNARQKAFQQRNKFGGSKDVRKPAGKVDDQKRDKLTTTEKFRQDLGKLVATLNASQPHYIRCIKPNDQKMPQMFDSPKCMTQLACNGVLETVTLRKAGFSNRMTFDRFLDRFFVCLGTSHPQNKEGIHSFLTEFLKDEHLWAIGHSKVFLRDIAIDKVGEKQKEMWQGKAVILQSFIRSWYAQKKLQELIERAKSAVVFQKYVRVYHAVREFLELKRLWEEKLRRVTKLQCFVRQFNAKKCLEELYQQNAAATILQKCTRRWYALTELEVLREMERARRLAAAIKLQNFVRNMYAMKTLADLQEAERKRKEEEERKRREEEERIRREEEERKRKEEEARRQREEEERLRREAERLRQEEEERQRKAEEDRKRKEEEEQRQKEEEEARLKLEEEERARKEAERIAEEQKRKEEAQRQKEEEARLKLEEEERARKEAERIAEEQKRKEEEEQRQKEEAARLKLEDEKIKREEAERIAEAERKRKMDEEAKRKAEEDYERQQKAADLEKQREQEELRRREQERKQEELKHVASAEALKSSEAALAIDADAKKKQEAYLLQLAKAEEERQRLNAEEEAQFKAARARTSVAPLSPTRPIIPRLNLGAPSSNGEKKEVPVVPAGGSVSASGSISARGPKRGMSFSMAKPPGSPKVSEPETPGRKRGVSELVVQKAPTIQTASSIVLQMSSEDKQKLDDFLAELGLSSLVDTFTNEAIDMDTMLAWEDPKKELSELGVTQKGVVFRITKGLDGYRTKHGVKSSLLSTTPSVQPEAPPDSARKRGLSLASLFTPRGGNPVTAPVAGKSSEVEAPLSARSRNKFEPQEYPDVDLSASTTIPFDITLIRGRIMHHEKVVGVSSIITGKMDLYARVLVEKTSDKRKLAQHKTWAFPASFDPLWDRPQVPKPIFSLQVPLGWAVKIEVWDERAMGDVKVGEYVWQYEDIKILRNGKRWIPVKFEGTFAGEVQVAISDLDEYDLELKWEADILGEDFEVVKLPLLPDDKGPLELPLVRLLCEDVETSTAVLYLHSFSDYFWCQDIAHNFVDEGYHFYSLDFRRYGRSMRPHIRDDKPNSTTTLMEYYEELHTAINFLKKFDGITKLMIVGQGLGGLIATLFLSDHPESEVDALCLLSPFFALNRSWVDSVANLAKTWLGAFDPTFACNNFSRLYHESIHKQGKGDWDWDLKKKPMDGFPIYAGWLQMVAESQRRVGLGLQLTIPILVFLSAGSMVAKEWSEDVGKNDIIMNVKIAKETAEKLGPTVKVELVKDAIHDILVSADQVREQVFEQLFEFFAWMVDEVPADENDD